MADDPDAMWKPGFVPPAASAAPTASTAPTRPTTPTGPAVATESGVAVWRTGADRRADPPGPPTGERAGRSRRRPWRALVAVVASIGVVGAALAVVLRSGDPPAPRRPAPGEVAGADERRLPRQVDRLWSLRLPGTGNAKSTSVLVGGGVVVAVVDDGSRSRSQMVGIDAESGELRWRRSFAFAPSEVTLLGVIDGVVLAEQRDLTGRRLFGLAASDGASLWERRAAADSGVNTVLLGTDVVTDLSLRLDRVAFVEPGTGEEAGDLVGRVLGTDLSGRWYFRIGDDRLVTVDLSDGWSEPVAVEGGLPPMVEPVVVDGRLLALDDGRVVEADLSVAALTPLRPDRAAPEIPDLTGMFPAGGSSLVAVGDGVVVGLELDGDAVRRTWARTGALRAFGLTERGLVVVVEERTVGFAAAVEHSVVDGVTGDRLMATSVEVGDEPPMVVGDGVVARFETVDGVSRVGYDLDGGELWRLGVTGKLGVGDELVVVLDDTPSGYELTGYGRGPP